MARISYFNGNTMRLSCCSSSALKLMRSAYQRRKFFGRILMKILAGNTREADEEMTEVMMPDLD